jgi:hypothetical protein
MASQETGKQRATRIPLDYYKEPNSLERWKLGLGLAALLLTTGWLAAGLLQSDQGRTNYSRGPVAAVHATWEDNCTVCHVPFSPIRGNFWASGEESSKNCQACHAGPTHHVKQNFEPACAACHHDHRGRDASLVRIPVSDCTQCHSDLAKNLKDGTKTDFENAVTQFTTNHPEFRSRKTDPGRIRFNHKVHMTAGFGTKFKLADIIDPAERQRYQEKESGVTITKGGLLQLQCTSCHRLDSNDFTLKRDQLQGLPDAAVLPRRSAGATMLPIIYENQCQACHPLTFERNKENEPRSGYVSVRHRLQPKPVHQFLEGHYTAKALEGDFKIFDEKVPPIPLPGKGLRKDEQPVRDFIRQRVARAERLLFSDNTCGKCHAGAKLGGRIEPANIPDVWLKFGLFNHSAHRAVDCRSCHPGAYPFLEDNTTPNPRASITSSDVLIPDVANCRQCHAPRSNTAGKVVGGARFDCTECHRYHNGDHPWQGIGTHRRGAPEQQRRDIEHFLSGLRPADAGKPNGRRTEK